MRICLISSGYPSTQQTINGLRNRGHEVHEIFSDGNASEVNLDELDLFRGSAPGVHAYVANAIAMWRQFLEVHQRDPFDVVEVSDELTGGLFQSLTGCVPTVVKLHSPRGDSAEGGGSPRLDDYLVGILERLSMLGADALCTPTRHLAETVAGELGISSAEIHLVREPADLCAFSEVGEKALPKSNSPVVLFAGPLDEAEGVRYFAEAIPTVRASFPDAKFFFVGTDTDTAPGGKSMLQYLKAQLIKHLEVVRFITHASPDAIASYYRSADICVVPSTRYNAHETCIEAMSCGVPVVATAAGGTVEYVANERFGLIVPPRDSEALATGLCKLLGSEDTRRQYGQAARDFVHTHLRVENFAAQMEAIYKVAIESHEQKRSLYAKPGLQALRDALQLINAYEANLYDTVYAHSVEFRIRHWARYLRKTPLLAIATMLSAMLNKLFVNARGQKPWFVKRLDNAIAQRTPPRYSITMLLADQLEDADETHSVSTLQLR